MAAPRNGLKAVSTFAGAGGSSTGYRIAGFDVLWANEYDAHAASCYRANYPSTKVDQRDIRTVKPEEILGEIGMNPGELDVFDGSPPCFLAGTPVVTERGIVAIEDVIVGDRVLTHKVRWRPVTATMFREAECVLLDGRTVVTPSHLYYSRASREDDPEFTQAASAQFRFLAIPFSDGVDCSEDPDDFRDGGMIWKRLRKPVVPAGSHRVHDLTVEEDHSFVADGYVVHNCQSFSTAGKRKMSDPRSDLFFEYARILRGLRPRAFVAENVSGMTRGVAQGMFKMVMAELKSCGYRVEARMLDAQWLGVPQMRRRVIFIGFREDLGLDPAAAFPRPLPYRSSVAEACPWIVRVVRCVNFDEFARSGRDPGATMVPADSQPSHTIVAGGPHMGTGFCEAPAGAGPRVIHSGAPYGQDRGDITDEPAPTIGTTHSGQFHVVGEGAKSALPPESMKGTELPPCIAREAELLKPGEQSDKYFSLVRAHPDRPCPTVTVRAGTGAAGVIHPTERRKFTIAELKRIASFPDDMVLVGPYSLQWKVIGNSVPPKMMAKIAAGVRDALLSHDGKPPFKGME